LRKIRRRKESCVIVKVDFEKAYDSMRWKFLEYMMARLGFESKWIRCMKGSYNTDIGLRQEDPLALFCFQLLKRDYQRS